MTDVLDCLFRKFDLADSGCWLYRGYLTRGGYSLLRVDGVGRNRHVVSYETFVGPVPAGLQLDHLCRQPACFNPRHLEPVTPRENLLRSDAWSGVNSRKTHCPQDHAYDGVNSAGARICRTCQRAARARYQQRIQTGVQS